MHGKPLFTEYKKPPEVFLFVLACAGFVLFAIGVYTALIPSAGSCTGRGGFLCLLARALGELLIRQKIGLHVAEGALWVAMALLAWVYTWHLYVMWYRPKKPPPKQGR